VVFCSGHLAKQGDEVKRVMQTWKTKFATRFLLFAVDSFAPVGSIQRIHEQP